MKGIDKIHSNTFWVNSQCFPKLSPKLLNKFLTSKQRTRKTSKVFKSWYMCMTLPRRRLWFWRKSSKRVCKPIKIMTWVFNNTGRSMRDWQNLYRTYGRQRFTTSSNPLPPTDINSLSIGELNSIGPMALEVLARCFHQTPFRCPWIGCLRFVKKLDN